MRKSKMVKLIIEAIQRPGEDYTDGECMDEVVRIIEEAGYDFKWDEWHKSQDKNTGYRLMPVSEYRRD
jgi:hypothetical protein